MHIISQAFSQPIKLTDSVVAAANGTKNEFELLLLGREGDRERGGERVRNVHMNKCVQRTPLPHHSHKQYIQIENRIVSNSSQMI